MPTRRLDESGLQALARACADPVVRDRFLTKLVLVPGSECVWWTGAVSGRGHGRFWYAANRVVIAHRFSWALKHGARSLADVEVLGHRCDNPLCQNIHPEHVVATTNAENRREWAARRTLAGSPLADPRGARGRSVTLRDLARADPRLVAVDLDRARALYGEQLGLW